MWNSDRPVRRLWYGGVKSVVIGSGMPCLDQSAGSSTMGDKAQLIICAARDGVPRKRLRRREHGRGGEPRRRGEADRLCPLRQQRRSVPRRCAKAFRAGCFRRSRRRSPCRYAIGSQQIARELLDLVLDPSKSVPIPHCPRRFVPFSDAWGIPFMALEFNKLHEILADILEQAAQDGCLTVSNPTGRGRAIPGSREGRTPPSLPVRSKLPTFPGQDRRTDRRGHRLLHGPIRRAGRIVILNRYSTVI